MLDRSPDEMGSICDDDMGDSESEIDDANETTTDGERIIYPWMKKIHVAGVGELPLIYLLFHPFALVGCGRDSEILDQMPFVTWKRTIPTQI